MANPIGLTMPLAHTTSSLGYVAFTTQEIDATYYNLKSLLLTNWGERPNHYFMGANLIEFLFNPNNQDTKDQITQRIEAQVAQWLPYVLLNSVLVEIVDPDGHGMRITVNFSIKGRQDLNAVLNVVVPSSGA